MSEVVSVHIGGAGIKTGLQYWRSMQTEYSEGQQRPNNFFHEESKGQNLPRALFIDTDTRANLTIKKSGLRFDKDSADVKQRPTYGTFAEGMYHSGADMRQQITQALRMQVEKCDTISGIIMTHSLTGGAGGGTGSAVLNLLRDVYNQKIIIEDFILSPGKNEMNVSPLAPYNMVLAIHYLIQKADSVINIQNSAVSSILASKRIQNQSFNEANKFIGRCLAEHCAPYRFSGQLNTNQRKRITNLIPFYRIKFIRASLSSQNERNYIVSATTDERQLISDVNHCDPWVLSIAATIRDPLAYEEEVHQSIIKQIKMRENRLTEWIPCSTHICLGDNVRKDWGCSAWLMINGSNNIKCFKLLQQNFKTLFGRRAFLHHYTGAGMSRMQLTEAESNLNDLMWEYSPHGAEQADDDYFDYQ